MSPRLDCFMTDHHFDCPLTAIAMSNHKLSEIEANVVVKDNGRSRLHF